VHDEVDASGRAGRGVRAGGARVVDLGDVTPHAGGLSLSPIPVRLPEWLHLHATSFITYGNPMHSTVEIDIVAPQARVAALLADPESNTQWMDDLDRCEPLSGPAGSPGSRYRLVPKKGSMVFVATVISRRPEESRLELDSPTVSVAVTGRFVALAPDRTRLISEQEFTFKGVFSRFFGLLATTTIRKAHRRHMEAFKRFVEAQE
jgi:polyketide cyclase/dehydrase/lipid transport protein